MKSLTRAITLALILIVADSASGGTAPRTSEGKWTRFSRTQTEEWYSTDDAREVASNVLLYQKDSGGWPKNVPMHLPMSYEDKIRVAGEKNSREASKKGCMDNDATTSEIRFLAHMWRVNGDARYLDGARRGVRFILDSQYPNAEAPDAHAGGWPQYYPLRGGYSDYFTFNDNLHLNNMLLLRDLMNSSTEVSAILPHEWRVEVEAAYRAGLQCILDCQVTEDGVKTLWCAQHDPYTLLPAEGRPHELPSYSADEGTSLLWFLMSVDEPSAAVVDAVEHGVAFLESTAISGKKPEFVYNDRGERIDEVVVDSDSARMWGRFIQLGGDVARKVYPDFFERLKSRRPRHLTVGSDTISIEMWRNAVESYDPGKAHQPIFSIYDDSLPHHLFRFLYMFGDVPSAAPDGWSYKFAPSLNASRRIRYRYLGTWPDFVLKESYPAWRERMGKGKLAEKE
ncbi:pectate lyase [uncultured Muribaculum sp.]|uniref:pectate lyase n=1 Tax=uncultured Muribaculum sp. TaxID=1918613 RepID=UPI0025DBC05F|nr:pectate lyase [uncultured Muribaculum sp.]